MPELELRDDDRISNATLGARLRQRRKIIGRSLQEVSKRAKLSIGLLSEIERGITAPSPKMLGQICDALNMPIKWLFDEHNATPPTDADVVVRLKSRRTLDLGPKGMWKELMTPDSVPGIQMMRIVIHPGGTSGPKPYNHAIGAKCGTVVAGRLALEIDGVVRTLNKGDSFAFPATAMHRYWCLGQTPVDLIWVVAPAIY
jgi:transcriptional regulator with XRE-family HTH domain